jgi:hypothetical protein
VEKKIVNRRSDRRKNDEDIAERVSGGVRVDRASFRREERSTSDDAVSQAADKSHPRRRRRTDPG